MDGEFGGFVHAEHPFAVPPDVRDPLRQLRGRLASAVTVWTAEHGGRRAGLTVASVTCAEPGALAAAVGADTDLLEVVEASRRLVVHVLDWRSRQTADRFGLAAPAPGGPFAAEDWTATAWGPRLTATTTWAGCRLESAHPFGHAVLVVATVEHAEAGDLPDPLVWQRGDYRHLR